MIARERWLWFSARYNFTKAIELSNLCGKPDVIGWALRIGPLCLILGWSERQQ